MSRSSPNRKSVKRKPGVDTRGLLPRKKPPKVKVMSVQELKEELRQKNLRKKRSKELLRERKRKGVRHVGGKART